MESEVSGKSRSSPGGLEGLGLAGELGGPGNRLGLCPAGLQSPCQDHPLAGPRP